MCMALKTRPPLLWRNWWLPIFSFHCIFPYIHLLIHTLAAHHCSCESTPPLSWSHWCGFLWVSPKTWIQVVVVTPNPRAVCCPPPFSCNSKFLALGVPLIAEALQTHLCCLRRSSSLIYNQQSLTPPHNGYQAHPERLITWAKKPPTRLFSS